MGITKIILASASPRRLELMRQIGVDPIVHVAEIDETPFSNEQPHPLVRRMAEEKATCIAAGHVQEDLVIGADTVVVAGDRIFGKPVDFEDASAMLSCLSGTCHQVLTAVCVSKADVLSTRIVESTVRFRELSEMEIEAYWQTGEPLDKAGAYAVQGLAAIFIEEIQGSYSAIMGLPLYEVTELLAEAGVKVLDLDI